MPDSSLSNYQLFNEGLVGFSAIRIRIGCFFGESGEATLNGRICFKGLCSEKVRSLSQS